MRRRPEATDSERIEQRFSAATELRALSRGRYTGAALQVGISFLEGVLEAAILTLFARLALRAVDTDADFVFIPGLGERSLMAGLLTLVALIAARLGSGLLNAFLSSRLQHNLVRTIRHEALNAYSGSSWLSQSNLDDGDVQQLVVNVPNGISGQLAGLLINVGHIAIMVSMLGYSMLTDAQLTASLILVIILSTFLLRPLRALIKRAAKRALVHQKALSSGVAQLTAIRFEAQAFGLTEATARPLHDVVETDADQSERLSRLKGSVVPLYTTVTYLAVSLSILVLLNTDANSLERTGPILLVVLRSLSYGTAIQQAASSLASLRPSLELFRDRVDDLRSGEVLWGTAPLERFNSFQFDGVTFAYPECKETAVRGINFEITRGMRVGIVGPSGSGKSTAIRLLLGLFQPQLGFLLVNEKPIHDYTRKSWTERIGVVPQDGHILPASIAENIRFFREGITEDDIWLALEIADLRKEIEAMPDGLRTQLGPGHRSLSGGQQQRLTIARAFAGRPDLVVMDEPTSSIDALSEAAISSAINRIPQEVTVVLVSHRPKILEGCNILLTIEDGALTGVGSPAEMFETSRYLRTLTELPEM